MKKSMMAVLLLVLLVLPIFSIEYEKKASPFSFDLLGGINFPVGNLGKGWNMGFNVEGRFCYRYNRTFTAFADFLFASFPTKYSGSSAQMFALTGGVKGFFNNKKSGLYMVLCGGIGYVTALSYDYYSGYTHYIVTISSEKATLVLLGGGGWTFPIGEKINFYGETKLVFTTIESIGYIPVSLGFSIRL